jgi:magnesium transporter
VAVTTTLFRGGERVPEGLPLEDVSEAIREHGALVWIDVVDPSEPEILPLAEELSLPDFAVEDALHAHQRPKVDHYGEVLFVVAYGARLEGARIQLQEVGIFVGETYVVTVRQDPAFALDEVEARLARGSERLRAGATYLAYVVLDAIIDSLFPAAESLERQIEDLEDRMLLAPGEGPTTELALTLRRDLLYLRHVVVPLHDLLVHLDFEGDRRFGSGLEVQLRDLLDHVTRLSGELDIYRELLDGALNAHLTAVQNRLSEIVLRLSAWAAIVVVPTLIASIYGMNFDHMPELHWRLGYPYSLALMLGTALGLFAYFRRRGWT